jgi:hypothetical protein
MLLVLTALTAFSMRSHQLSWYGFQGRDRTACRSMQVVGYTQMPKDWVDHLFSLVSSPGQLSMDKMFLGLLTLIVVGTRPPPRL